MAVGNTDQGGSAALEKEDMRLEIANGPFQGQIFLIEEGSNLVGRWDPDTGAFPEVDLENYDQSAKVSRKHAIIRRNGDTVTIEDLGSLNGTFINRGSKLETGTRHPLQPGDEVIIGKVFLVFKV